MEKEVIIQTERINCYGTRVITAGIDTTQFLKNPILLFMHKRDYSIEYLPIGTIENLRYEGSNLIGTPVFDEDDSFALKLKSKWEKGILRMASAGVEPLEYSSAPEYIQPGQTRPTVIRSKLIEVSIVDIGANDDAIQLYQPNGKLLTLSKYGQCDFIPLLNPVPDAGTQTDNSNINNKREKKMNEQIPLLLGLPKDATELQVMAGIQSLKDKARQVETLQLMNITTIVDGAISSGRVPAENKEQLITLGKKIGAEELNNTIQLMKPAVKPLNLVNPGAQGTTGKNEYKTLSEVPEAELLLMREKDPATYSTLYEKEFGFKPIFEK